MKHPCTEHFHSSHNTICRPSTEIVCYLRHNFDCAGDVWSNCTFLRLSHSFIPILSIWISIAEKLHPVSKSVRPVTLNPPHTCQQETTARYDILRQEKPDPPRVSTYVQLDRARARLWRRYPKLRLAQGLTRHPNPKRPIP